jgi:membrane protease YdiL (CAAX protease family)
MTLPASAAVTGTGAVAAGPAAFVTALPKAVVAAVPGASAFPGSSAAAAPAGRNDAAAPITAHQQLSLGAERLLPAAAPAVSVESGVSALDSVFNGSTLKTGTVAGPTSGKDGGVVSSGLSASSLGESRDAGGASQTPGEPQAPQPARQSLSRSARVGLLAAVIPLAITFATMAAATALGYHFHAGYQNPFPEKMTLVTAATSLIGAAFLAPVAEEMIFRGGIMGGIRAMTKNIRGIGQFWIPAVVSSVLFVSVHELSDPVLFATRFVHSMILSYAFHKEGYTGSMFAHGIFNGLLVMPLVLGVLLPGALATVATLALTPLSLWLAVKAFKKLKAEQPDKASGRLQAYAVSPVQALLLAAALMAGFFFIVGNAVWAVGAAGWLFYAIKRWMNR